MRHHWLLGLLLLSTTGPAWSITEESLKLYNQGVTLERQGRMEAAIQSLRQAVAMDPDDPMNVLKLASLLSHAGRTNEAISVFKQASRLTAQDPMIDFSLANLYEQAGDFAAAEATYVRALRNNPQYPYGYFNLARVATQLKKYDKAIGHYQAFLQAYPQHYEGRRYLAKLLQATSKPKEAVAQLNQLKSLHPQRFSDHLDLARALTETQAPDKALQELQAALSKGAKPADIAEETGRAHEALGQTQFALDQYQKALSLNPEKKALHLNVASLFQKTKQYDAAVPHYLAYLKSNPDDGRTRYALASLYMEKKDFGAALGELLQAQNQVKSDAERYTVEKDIAYTFQMSGNPQEAIPRYEALLTTTQGLNDPQLKTNLAIAYHQAKRLDDAAKLYQEIYRPGQSPDSLRQDLYGVLMQLAQKAYDEVDDDGAIQRYKEALGYAQPKQIDPLLGMGNVYLRAQNWGKAEEVSQQMLARDPQSPTAKLFAAKLAVKNQQSSNALGLLAGIGQTQNLTPEEAADLEVLAGEAHLQADNVVEAEAAFERAVGLKPDLEAAWVSLGTVAQRTGHLNRAIEAYQKALALNPNSGITHYNLGVVYYDQSLLVESAEAFKNALAADSALIEAYYGLGVVLERQKRFAEAAQAYESYLKEPEVPMATEAKERLNIVRDKLAAPVIVDSPNSTIINPNTPQQPKTTNGVPQTAPAANRVPTNTPSKTPAKTPVNTVPPKR
jgi:tetratricopeptide (TPR) repeat protein